MSDLARKLGIAPGQTLCLLDVPPATETLIRDVCPPGVDITVATVGTVAGSETDRYDQIFFGPTTLAGLPERFAALQRAIAPAGAIWAVMPNKRAAARRGILFAWEEVQAAALTHRPRG